MSKLVPCKECKKKVSSTATKCPHCGSGVPNNLTAWATIIGWGVAIYFIIWPFVIKPMLE